MKTFTFKIKDIPNLYDELLPLLLPYPIHRVNMVKVEEDYEVLLQISNLEFYILANIIRWYVIPNELILSTLKEIGNDF
jgi:hypothetical protein